MGPIGDAAGSGIKAAAKSGNCDAAREAAFDSAGMTNPENIRFSKYDDKTGTVVEFKGDGGAKVGYDGPHAKEGLNNGLGHADFP